MTIGAHVPAAWRPHGSTSTTHDHINPGTSHSGHDEVLARSEMSDLGWSLSVAHSRFTLRPVEDLSYQPSLAATGLLYLLGREYTMLLLVEGDVEVISQSTTVSRSFAQAASVREPSLPSFQKLPFRLACHYERAAN